MAEFPDIAAAAASSAAEEEARRQGKLQDNFNIRNAALSYAVQARSTAPVRDAEDAANLVTVAGLIEDFLRSNEIPKGV